MRGVTIQQACAMAAAALLAGPALAQVKAGSESGLGLTGAEIPAVLRHTKADPYKAPSAPACLTIPFEITQLNELIGADLDAQGPAQDKSLTDRGIQMSRGMVPYGGLVRFVTGANKKDQELREAILAGYARRGYLRGLQANMTCAPEPPAGPEMATPKVRSATKRKSR